MVLMLEQLALTRRLLDDLPINMAMPDLLPGCHKAVTAHLAQGAITELADSPELQAAIWLYVDDLDRSHSISQGIASPIGAYWHGIMHRREGDFWNSKYWFRQARGIDLGIAGYEPSEFVDRVEAARGQNPPDLVEMQRHEWQALFNYCVGRNGE